MIDSKTILNSMFGARPAACVSPIQRPRIESFDVDGRREGLELYEALDRTSSPTGGLAQVTLAGVPVVTPKVPVMHAMPKSKRPPPLSLDEDDVAASIKKKKTKKVPPGWMVPAPPPPKRCGECGDDVLDCATTRCQGSSNCDRLVCDKCHAQSRRGQLRKLAPALRDQCASPRGQAAFRHLLQESWSGGRVCEACLDRLEKRLVEEEEGEE